MLDLKRLRYFSTIVELGGISRAAKQLGVAQPALSQSVASLEAFLGLKLLNRTNAGVSVTEAGMLLYQHACLIQKQLKRAIEEVKAKDTAIEGMVVIGFPVSTAGMLSLPVLKETRRSHPNIRLQINAIPSQLVSEMLRNSRIDIGVIFDDGLGADMEAEPLLDEELTYIAPPGELGAQELGTMRLADIVDVPLMIPGIPNSIHRRLITAFELIGAQPNIIAEIDALSSIRDAVTEGVGSSILPWAAVNPLRSRSVVDIYRIVDPSIVRRMYICHSAISPLSRAAARVRDIVIEQAHDLVVTGKWQAANLAL